MEVRRKLGAVYTPNSIVTSMLEWAKSRGRPDRIVDPGAGSGRFSISAACAFPKAEIIAVEIDPEAVVVLRENLRASRLSGRVKVVVDDYRAISIPRIDGRTLFIGNPPYVRHHDIEPRWKRWYSDRASSLGIRASQLAGLHLHFFLKTRLLARSGDYGAFITAAEWLDVNYGSALKSILLNGMGLVSLDLYDASEDVFNGALTTAAVTCFELGSPAPKISFGRLGPLLAGHRIGNGQGVLRESLRPEQKWSVFAAGQADVARGSDHTKLGDRFRVKRGQVTGANSVWIVDANPWGIPDRYLRPAVTRARELIQAREALIDASRLRHVVDLPANLDDLDRTTKRSIEKFLIWARSQRADQGYIARHRRAWWSVGLYAPAPILCTYMGRRRPVFVRNICGARHVNIAHGLYPKGDIDREMLDAVAFWLNKNVAREWGRTYAGGLTKFEPRELEQVPLAPLGIVLREYRDELERRRTQTECGRGESEIQER
jgi:hypothetical protein